MYWHRKVGFLYLGPKDLQPYCSLCGFLWHLMHVKLGASGTLHLGPTSTHPLHSTIVLLCFGNQQVSGLLRSYVTCIFLEELGLKQVPRWGCPGRLTLALVYKGCLGNSFSRGDCPHPHLGGGIYAYPLRPWTPPCCLVLGWCWHIVVGHRPPSLGGSPCCTPVLNWDTIRLSQGFTCCILLSTSSEAQISCTYLL